MHTRLVEMAVAWLVDSFCTPPTRKGGRFLHISVFIRWRVKARLYDGIYCDFSNFAPNSPSSRWNITRHFVSFSVLSVEDARSQALLDTVTIMGNLAERLRNIRNTVTYSIAKMGFECPCGAKLENSQYMSRHFVSSSLVVA